MACNAPQFTLLMSSDYTYQWFMDNNPADFLLTAYNPHIFISKSGILYFSSVDGADDRDYHCTVSITDGAAESRSSPAYSLQVTYRDGECKPILHDICSLIKITIGQSFPFLNWHFLNWVSEQKILSTVAHTTGSLLWHRKGFPRRKHILLTLM